MNDRTQTLEKIATGLETKLENALTDLRRLQNGANVHHLANVLCSVQAVLNGSKDLKGNALKTIFSNMKELSHSHAALFDNVDKALEDGRLSEDEFKNINDQIGLYSEKLIRLSEVLASLKG